MIIRPETHQCRDCRENFVVGCRHVEPRRIVFEQQVAAIQRDDFNPPLGIGEVGVGENPFKIRPKMGERATRCRRCGDPCGTPRQQDRNREQEAGMENCRLVRFMRIALHQFLFRRKAPITMEKRKPVTDGAKKS